VVFAAGSSNAIKTVSVSDDGIYEATETVVLTLALGTGYTIVAFQRDGNDYE
jgi:hypothetical protein